MKDKPRDRPEHRPRRIDRTTSVRRGVRLALSRIVAVLGQLRLVIGPDACRPPVSAHRADSGASAFIGRLALGRIDLPAFAVQVEAVKTLLSSPQG